MKQDITNVTNNTLANAPALLPTSDVRLPNSVEPSDYKPQPIDWDGWAEERRKYGAYKDAYKPERKIKSQPSKNTCIRKKKRQISHNGKTQTPRQWCEELGIITIKPETLWKRIVVFGWSFEKATTTLPQRTIICHEDRCQTIAQWSRELGIPRSTLQNRLQTLNLSVKVAFSPNNNLSKKTLITYLGETKSIPEWAKTLGFSKATLYNRINQFGWSVEKALTTPVRKYTQTQ